jgi:hypothetical protein
LLSQQQQSKYILKRNKTGFVTKSLDQRIGKRGRNADEYTPTEKREKKREGERREMEVSVDR